MGARPLPPGLPRLRDRIVYHEHMNPVSGGRPSSYAGLYRPNLDDVADKIDGSSLGFAEISLNVLKVSHEPLIVALV